MKTFRTTAATLFILAALALFTAPGAAQDALLDVDKSDGADVLTVLSDGGFVVNGTFGAGSHPFGVADESLMWYPAKSAFRVGSKWEGTIGDYSIAMGRRVAASDRAAVALGQQATASGSFSFAAGRFSTASGEYAVAIGDEVTASADRSTAMGSDASTNGHHGTFVYGDNSTTDALQATGPNQFLVRAVGGVGLGTNSPQTQLDVSREVSGSAADIGNHVAYLNNEATSSGDVLVLQSDATDPGAAVNFITFRDAGDNIGSIEGNGTGGVELKSGSGDFAEMLPRRRASEEIEPGEVVGVHGGEVTKRTAGADRVMVVTDRALVLGNDPGEGVRAGYEKVAFLGRVPVKTRGPVSVGDLLVASGAEDGSARAVSAERWDPRADGPVVGRAWGDASGPGVHEVIAAVGLGSGTEVLGRRLREQADALETMRRRNTEQQARIERQDERIERLEAMVEELVESGSREATQR